ncbi:hypothetical protein NUW58_g5085 [Xylaria curta]|uniref:Uncharacterized protein n=1 Tax=Xylaria curta TaxID=42375 RepID=A0ACC1P4M4_9PEZI|nr:hypothetical protein NUW58_g5085 [Xylaria curta]
MYSFNEESDGEDHANRPSPSNDRFPFSSPGATPVIPNIFILDPTLRQGPESGSESKVSKTDEEELLNSQLEYGYRSSASLSSLSPGCPEHTTTATGTILPRHHYQVACLQPSVSPSSSRPLSGPTQSPSVYSDAPPAYSPSPNSLFSFRSSSSQQDLPSNYRTFRVSSIMGQEVESERLLGSQPESMGQPVDEERDTRPWARRARRHLPGWLRWKHALLALVTLIVSVAFLSGIASSGPNKPNDPTTRPALPIDERPPPKVPDDGSEIPGSSGSPNDPVSPGLPFQSPFCEGRQYRYDDQELSVDFERSHNITFKEGVYRNPGSKRVRVGGRIDVRRLKESDGDPRVVLEIATNDPSLRLYTSLDADSQEIEINIPETFESSVPGQRPCVEIRGAVWAPKDAELGILSLHAIHLDILLSNDLSLRVADYTALSSVTGDIKAAVNIPASYGKISDSLLSNPDYTFVPASESWRFDSRVIEVRTTAGSIAGNWPLYDLLGLHTTSGSLEVSITPQEELKSKPKSAVLSLTSTAHWSSGRAPPCMRRQAK